MTTFEYRCTKCGHVHEKAYRHLHPPKLRRCPRCGGRARLVIGRPAAIVFRGTGFYATDYRHRAGGSPDEEAHRVR